MAREQKLQIVKKGKRIYARTTYVGLDGKRHAVWRKGKNATEAKKNLQKRLDELRDDAGAITHAKKTFADLAKWYEDRYLIEPVYRDGRIIKGKRSWKSEKYLLRQMKAELGGYKLRSLTHGELEKYKDKRLHAEIVTKRKLSDGTVIETRRPRTIASVNRELMHIRTMLRKAQKEGWLLRVPFEEHDSLIRMSDERRRERTLSYDEERKLLAACGGPRKHLRPILICALSTGMRLGEILKLEWSHVQPDHIDIISTNTKTLNYRAVPITARLKVELESLRASFIHLEDKPDLVFGVETNVKRSFRKACEIAGVKHGGIDGLTFHCLRHTAGTRMVKQGMSLAEVARVLGHSQISTTYRYISADSDVMDKARAALAFRPPEPQTSD